MVLDVLTPGTFPNGLVHLKHLQGRKYEVAEPFQYVSKAGRLFTVPMGFITDGGSVPRLMWTLYPPFGSDCDEAYVLHDYIYAHAEALTMNRGEGDALMREVMDVKGFRKTGRGVLWLGVRLGGWKAWGKHRNAAKTPEAAG